MIINIEDMDILDFSDMTTGGILRSFYPGEILREKFLNPLAMTAHVLALKVPAPRINDIGLERRAITPDTALKLARYIGTIPDFCLNFQTAFGEATKIVYH
ncbi:MAG: HigA family addiction module antitoxin [Halobacteriota archaeon]